MNVSNDLLAAFEDNGNSVRLTRLANVFIVSFEPKYGENAVKSFSDLKTAEIDYAYHVHYFTKEQ